MQFQIIGKGHIAMPGHLTHDKSYFDIYKRLPGQLKEQYAQTWEQHRIFAQGHDLLLFYMFLHLPKYPELQDKLKIIEDHVQELAVNYIELLQETDMTAESKLFLYGYLIHHFMDAKLHPLIIYETGDLRSDKNAQALHLLVENMIDAYMLRKDGLDPMHFKIHQVIPSKKALTAETRSIVRSSFQKTYGLENFDVIFAQYNTMSRTFFRTLRYDPYGLKKVLFRPLDYILMGLFKPSILPFHFDGTECLDYLNLLKGPWTHPMDAAIVSTKSFDELYEDGVNETARMIAMLDEAIRDRATSTALKAIVPNISSIHGRASGLDYQFSYTKNNP